MLAQDLAECLRNKFIELLEEQDLPSMCPKLILVPTARVTLPPRRNVLDLSMRLVVEQVPWKSFFKPQTERSEGCCVTAATAREKSYFFPSST